MAFMIWSRSTGPTWNGLWQGPSQDIAEYNIEFQQALTDLAGSITDEQVKIEKYRSGLQHDLRELCRLRTSPTGARCANLTDIVQDATLQWRVSPGRRSSHPESRPRSLENVVRLQVAEPAALGALLARGGWVPVVLCSQTSRRK
jgi:hypothetical protein